jgi:hypothetical protein
MKTGAQLNTENLVMKIPLCMVHLMTLSAAQTI